MALVMSDQALVHPAVDALELPAVLHALSDPVRLQIVRDLDERGASSCGTFAVPVAKSTLAPPPRPARRRSDLDGARGTSRVVSLRRDDLDARFRASSTRSSRPRRSPSPPLNAPTPVRAPARDAAAGGAGIRRRPVTPVTKTPGNRSTDSRKSRRDGTKVPASTARSALGRTALGGDSDGPSCYPRTGVMNRVLGRLRAARTRTKIVALSTVLVLSAGAVAIAAPTGIFTPAPGARRASSRLVPSTRATGSRTGIATRTAST